MVRIDTFMFSSFKGPPSLVDLLRLAFWSRGHVFWKYPVPPIFLASKHFSTMWLTAQSATKRFFFSDGELLIDAFAYTIQLISTRSYYIYVVFKPLAHMIVVTPLHWFWYILYLYFFIISFYPFNVSILCIWYHWRWPRV